MDKHVYCCCFVWQRQDDLFIQTKPNNLIVLLFMARVVCCCLRGIINPSLIIVDSEAKYALALDEQCLIWLTFYGENIVES